jgi:glutaredoxin 3
MTCPICITLYSSEPCAFCAKAKALLERHGLRYQAVDLTTDASGREELAQRTGRMTFPQVTVDDEPIGGYSELELFVRSLAGMRCS